MSYFRKPLSDVPLLHEGTNAGTNPPLPAPGGGKVVYFDDPGSTPPLIGEGASAALKQITDFFTLSTPSTASPNPTLPPVPGSSKLDVTKIAIVGALGLGAFFLLRKK